MRVGRTRSRITGPRERNLVRDLNTEAFEANYLTRVIRQQMNGREAQVGEDLSADSCVMLNGLVTNVGCERGLIAPMR